MQAKGPLEEPRPQAQGLAQPNPALSQKKGKFVQRAMPLGWPADADRARGRAGARRRWLGRGNVGLAAIRCATKRGENPF